ncbi:MAG TPA: outer membrane lipoprotein carrier protein LolA [Candidatus Limnocylindria bacterium]|jgi:outer membrane lipoprotein-sorting protein|nr:outer membrane lipoprotein carrier protein LolA [Candidatus Limnocylindria bacterium]
MNLKAHINRFSIIGLAGLCLMEIRGHAAEDEGTVRLNHWLVSQTNITSWHADFIQTRNLKALTQPLTTRGSVWFVAPNRFRWELGQPPQSIALRTEGDLLVLAPKLKRAERYSLTEFAKGPMKDLASLMDTGFPRDAVAFKKQFELLGAGETNGVYQFRLAPRQSAVRKLLPELSIGISANDSQLRTTTLRFTDGSTLRNDFTNATVNIAIDPSLFAAALGNDWKVTEPMKQP